MGVSMAMGKKKIGRYVNIHIYAYMHACTHNNNNYYYDYKILLQLVVRPHSMHSAAEWWGSVSKFKVDCRIYLHSLHMQYSIYMGTKLHSFSVMNYTI